MLLRRLRIWLVVLAGIACGLHSRPTWAQALSDPVAVELKHKGDRAMEAGQYGKALDAYSRALAVEPNAALYYNRGRALQALGRNAEALTAFEAFENSAEPELRAAVADLDALVASVRMRVAEIQVAPCIEGATLHVRGRVLSLPLLKPLRFDPATLDFEVRASGHEPWHTRLSLTGGEVHELKPRLQKTEDRAVLLIRSPAAGSFVSIDGKEIGSVPVEVRLGPGEHQLLLTHPDYRDHRSQVVLHARERRALTIALDAVPRFYERWWFWTAVGVGVAGGVALAVALGTEREAGTGDIPPGQITAPLLRY